VGTFHFRPSILALALAVCAVATVALILSAGGGSQAMSALSTGDAADGQPRLLIGALAGVAMLVLANFAITEDREEHR
jgi:hypothetical protein